MFLCRAEIRLQRDYLPFRSNDCKYEPSDSLENNYYLIVITTHLCKLG